jgi:hypothetical protein
MSKAWRIITILGILCIALLTSAAHADLAHPDSITIEDVRAWRHMLEADDVLVVARYNISYGNLTAQPYIGINQTFSFTYIDSGDNTLGNSTAYPFYNLGYVKGLVAFYWSADDENKPAWGDLGNVTITGTDLFDSPPTASLTLTDSSWASGSQPSTLREDLRQWLLNQLIFLEMDWNLWGIDQGYTDRQISLTAVSSGTEYMVADATGETYLVATIPNITTICPLLFLLQEVSVTHTERDWDLTQQSSIETQHEGDVVGETGETIGHWLGGIDPIWAWTLTTLIGCLVIILIWQAWLGKLNAGLLMAYAIILLATPEGLFQMGLMALFAVIAILYLADIILTSRHQ